MKSARDLPAADAEQDFVRAFDLREIAAQPPTFWTRLWWGRAARVMKLVRRGVAPGGVVADVACASGSMTILLAEAGYRCVGVDLRAGFLRYARRKEDGTSVAWIQADALRLPLADGSCDAVILGEILEHVAEPRVLVEAAFRALRAGGVLICTTPNGAGFRDSALPSYADAARDLADLKARQFGPAGADHLFALRPRELLDLVPAGATGRLGYAASGLWCRALSLPARSAIFSAALEWVSRTGPWASRLSTGLILEIRRRGKNS